MGVSRRRVDRWVWSACGLLLAVGIVVLLSVLASSRAVRIDVTSTGRLELSPRTLRVLEGVAPGTEIVLAADLAARGGAGGARRVLDVLDELERAGDGLGVSVIDTASGAGRSSFEDLVRRLATRDAAGLAAARERTERTLGGLVSAGERLEGFAAALEDLRGRVSAADSSDLGARASRLRATAEQIGPMREHVGTLLDRRIAGESLADLPGARRVLVESAEAVRTLLRVTGNRMTALASGGAVDEETGNVAASLAERMGRASDELGALIAAEQAAALPGVVRVIGALESSEALLVLGPDGVAAVSMDDLFPAAAPGAPGSDPGRRAESLVVNALTTLGAADRPLVVVTHAGTSRVLAGGTEGPLASLVRRSGLRGVEWVEWPVAMEPERPGAIAAASADGRAVVYVVVGIDTSAQGGAERAARTAAVLEDLLAEGERVMVNLAVSTLPGLGESDPMAGALVHLGLEADSGRPVLAEVRRGSDRLVSFEHVVVGPSEGVGPGESIGGLAVALPWPVVIERASGDDADGSVSRLLSVGDVDRAWREGEWLGYWVTPAQQRPLLIEKPEPGGTRDAAVGDGAVAWAVERASGQRVLVVGSNLWLFDRVADRPAVIDGVVVQQNPGNAELFLAGVEWLAGNDDLLGRSAAALETPTVQAIEASRLSLIRWLLVGGLPVGLLLIGVAVRVVGG